MLLTGSLITEIVTIIILGKLSTAFLKIFRKLENLNNKNYSQDSRIDELEAELMRLRNECLEVQTRVDEVCLLLSCCICRL